MRRSAMLGVVATVACALAMCLCGNANAQAGKGVKLGTFTVQPFAEVKAEYDSNVDRLDDSLADGDVSLSLLPGVKVSQESKLTKMTGTLWGRAQIYADLTEHNHEDFGERLSLSVWERRLHQIKIDEAYQNMTEFDYGTGAIETRQIAMLGAALGKDFTDKLQGDIGYTFDWTDYESARLFDWYQHSLKLEGAHAITEKSSGTLTGTFGSQTSDGIGTDAQFMSFLLGMKTRLTQKVVGKVGLGWYQNEAVNDVSMLGYMVEGAWQLTPKILVQAVGNNSVEPATQNADNYKTVDKMLIAAKWTIVDEYAVSGSLTYIGNDYEEDVLVGDALEHKKDDTLACAARFTYTSPIKFLTAFCEGKYEIKDSSIAGQDYDQVVVSVGAIAAY